MVNSYSLIAVVSKCQQLKQAMWSDSAAHTGTCVVTVIIVASPHLPVSVSFY